MKRCHMAFDLSSLSTMFVLTFVFVSLLLPSFSHLCHCCSTKAINIPILPFSKTFHIRLTFTAKKSNTRLSREQSSDMLYCMAFYKANLLFHRILILFFLFFKKKLCLWPVLTFLLTLSPLEVNAVSVGNFAIRLSRNKLPTEPEGFDHIRRLSDPPS